MTARKVILEMGGAANYWLDPRGKAIQVQNHRDLAQQITGKKISNDATDRESWAMQGTVYKEMYDRGYIRVAITPYGNEMVVDWSGPMKNWQREWIAAVAERRALRVVNSLGREVMDYRHVANESLVDRLLK